MKYGFRVCRKIFVVFAIFLYFCKNGVGFWFKYEISCCFEVKTVSKVLFVDFTCRNGTAMIETSNGEE